MTSESHRPLTTDHPHRAPVAISHACTFHRSLISVLISTGMTSLGRALTGRRRYLAGDGGGRVAAGGREGEGAECHQSPTMFDERGGQKLVPAGVGPLFAGRQCL